MKTMPFLLESAEKSYFWGGTRLKTEYGKTGVSLPVAEAWECSTHPDGLSFAGSGRFCGESLKALLSAHPKWLGEHFNRKLGSELPVLVKLLDANLPLSVQVHPNDEYASAHEGQCGKAEFLYILEAEPGASIFCGFAQSVDKHCVAEHLQAETLTSILREYTVHKGDRFYIAPGLVHSIGGGIVAAEIQESSNVTYRLYDYNRIDSRGNRRPLQIEKALDVLDLSAQPIVSVFSKAEKEFFGFYVEPVCVCPYFTVERLELNGKAVLPSYTVCHEIFPSFEDSFQVFLCIEGESNIKTDSELLKIHKGDCFFAPAGCCEIRFSGKAEFLRVYC